MERSEAARRAWRLEVEKNAAVKRSLRSSALLIRTRATRPAGGFGSIEALQEDSPDRCMAHASTADQASKTEVSRRREGAGGRLSDPQRAWRQG